MPSAPRRYGSKPPRKPWARSGPDLRKGLTGRRRQETKRRILERDDFTCKACGCLLSGMKDSILDHTIPLAHGGSHQDENLQTLCQACSKKKTQAESGAGGG